MGHKPKFLLLDDVDPTGFVAGDTIQYDGAKFGRLAGGTGLYIPKSLVTTKGDLIAATGSGVVVRLPAGANGTFFTPDSSVAAGLKWIAALLASADVGLQADITPAQITANQNDYNPTGLATASVLRLSSDAARNITGILAGYDGRVLLLLNIGSFAITLKNASVSSTPANRFAMAADLVLKSGGGCALWYDVTAARWVVWAQSDVGTAGAGITIAELDGTPSGTPGTLKFPNGTLTDNGDGSFTFTPSAGGRYSLSVTTKTAAYTLTGSDDLVLGDVSGGAFTLTLPTAVGASGRIYYVKKIDSSVNALTVGTTSAQTIDGATTWVMPVQYDELAVVSDGANWQVI